MRSARSFQSSFTARSSPKIIRARPRAATSAKRPQSAPEGTTFAPTWQRAVSRPLSANAVKRPSRRRGTSSRKTRSTGSCTAVIVARLGLPSMPIHIRAEPGDYAEACLLPGDPLRAKYIAETYFDDVEQRNSERGLLGYTGN